jgi:segregation and condensation protein A
MSPDVSTPVYEGPFDMLLQLILREQVDIYEVNLSSIVDAYLVEIERMQLLDLDVATGFLLIAATLVELKARRLLPNPTDIDLDDEFALWEERDMLLARLLEAKTFKDVAQVFAALADDADLSFPRLVGPDERFAGLMPDLLEGTSVRRLQSAAIRALHAQAGADRRPVPRQPDHGSTVADAVAELIDELPRVSGGSRSVASPRTSPSGSRSSSGSSPMLELFKQGFVELDQVGAVR